MTKSREAGENEYTRLARLRAARTGEDVCAILRELRKDAIATGDSEAEKKIIQAEKYLGCRNRRKRGAS